MKEKSMTTTISRIVDYLAKNSVPPFDEFFVQICKNYDLTENTFWSISQEIEELQKRIISHFKGNFIIKNFVTCSKHLQQKIETV